MVPEIQVQAAGVLKTVKLGRLIPKSRPQALRFSTYFSAPISPPPVKVDYYSKASESLKRVYLNDQYGDCHDDKTEVLTEHGWRRWPEYDGHSLLATMHQETGLLEFQAPTSVKRREHNGPMAFAAHKGLDFAITPNHRMFYRPYHIPFPYVPGGAGYGPLQFGTVDSLPTRCMLPGATTGFVGTGLKTLVIGNRVWNGDDFLAMLSVILSDGWVREGHNKNTVSFCCFRADRREMVASLAYRLGIKETSYRPGIWTFNDAHLAEWLRANAYIGDEYRSPFKRVPDLVKVASQGQIENFLRFFGDQNSTAGRRQFYSSSPRLIDDLQELLLRVGKRGTIYDHGIRDGGFKQDGTRIQSRHPSFTLHEYQDSDIVLQKLKRCPTVEYDNYQGEVFCATVPNSTLVTRRNGRVLISGNCVIASAYHQEGLWSANSDGTAVLGTDKEVYSMYQGICGRGDNGCDISEVLNYTRDKGLPFNGVVKKIDGYVSVDNTEKLQVQVAIYIFGSLKLGINLPGDWTCTDCTWDVTNARVVGGHDVPTVGYDEKGVQIATWGGIVTITWPAFTSSKWITECYCPLAPDWYSKGDMAPNGIDAATLKADLAKLGGGVIPDPTPIPILDWLV